MRDNRAINPWSDLWGQRPVGAAPCGSGGPAAIVPRPSLCGVRIAARPPLPQVNDPQVNDPQVNDPQVNDPQVNDPQVNDPQVNDPQVNDPQVNDPPILLPRARQAGTTY
ncbi:hypothetical protein BSY238_954 [Methyloversatilis sp. RAC08]|nr:hypothetical protein BSY238_954 [Methyloversatilis sp. RAC08]